MTKRLCGTSVSSCIGIDITSRDCEFDHFNQCILDQTHNPEISLSERRTFGQIYRSNYQESISKFKRSDIPDILSNAEIDDLVTRTQENPINYEEWVSPHPGEIHLRYETLLHFPYDKFSDLLRAIANHASMMKEIILSVYRLADNSEIVRLLVYLLKLGVDVKIMIEINARGNEESNIRYAHQLKLLGADVIISDSIKKNHAKFIVLDWNDGSTTGMVMTGNLNENTANLYEDYCYITSNPDIVIPMKERVIRLLTSMSYPMTKSNTIFFTQDNAALTLVRNIKEQTDRGENGRIIIKCNIFTDILMMGLLENAANHGCQIHIICRGECCWKPSDPNVHVHRFIHKYLEHSRVYLFGDDTVYIGSLDMATHKLYGRFELICRIERMEMIHEIVNTINRMITDYTNRHYLLVSDRNHHQYRMLSDIREERTSDEEN